MAEEGVPFLIPRATSVRIPAGGLRIPSSGDEAPSVRLQASLDVWPHWLEIALLREEEAHRARSSLMAAHGAGDRKARARNLELEFQASLQGITAAAVCLESVYLAILPLIDKASPLARNATSKRTAGQRIATLLETCFLHSTASAEVLHQACGELFRLRNWAVHPPSRFQDLVLHQELGTAVEWRFATYTAPHCRAFAEFAGGALRWCFRRPRAIGALQEWANSCAEILRPIADEARLRWAARADPP
jgi:hypothetical protein